jgi:hypothetical protein
MAGTMCFVDLSCEFLSIRRAYGSACGEGNERSVDLQPSGRDDAAFALRRSRSYHEALPCRPKVGHQMYKAGVSRFKGLTGFNVNKSLPAGAEGQSP